MPLVLVVLLVAYSALAPDAAPRETRADPTDYQVYAALLEGPYAEVARSAFLVADRTLSKLPFGRDDAIAAVLRHLQEMDSLPAGLAEEFLRLGETEITLGAEEFGGRVPVILLEEEEQRRIGEEVLDDSGYPRCYPANGVITFSRVAYTEDARYALVHTLFHCGGRCGGGTLFLLERVDNAWIVQQTRDTLWI